MTKTEFPTFTRKQYEAMRRSDYAGPKSTLLSPADWPTDHWALLWSGNLLHADRVAGTCLSPIHVEEV